jgi:hypothetical protein
LQVNEKQCHRNSGRRIYSEQKGFGNGKKSEAFAVNLSEHLGDIFTMVIFKMFIKTGVFKNKYC